MRILPLGDTALLIDLGDTPDALTAAKVLQLGRALESALLPGVLAVVPAFTTIGVHYDGSLSGREELIEAWIRAIAPGPGRDAADVRTIEIPVCYGNEFGPDLAEVAQACGITPEEVAALHAGAQYDVRVIGFAPGFPYLAGLPKALQRPRRPTPRVRVSAGSVAIAGTRTGIYPLESPGGWHVIGRTPLALFTPMEDPPVLLRRGDRIRFQPITPAQFDSWPRSAQPGETGLDVGTEGVLVLNGGGLTTVQDFGRSRLQIHGISPGGAMDQRSARVANLLVGNPEDAAVLEMTFHGPTLMFQRPAVIALTGARVDGLPWGRPFPVQRGEKLSLGPLAEGVRGYLAFGGGGVATPKLLGSRSTYLRSNLPGPAGSPLMRGMRVPLLGGDPDAIGQQSVPWFVQSGASIPRGLGRTIRVVRGPQADWFSDHAWETLLRSEYRLSMKFDRMGLRFEGSRIPPIVPRELVSQPVADGAVQIPPDGLPIMLGRDRQTLGGYPVIAYVISTDFGNMAQLQPGEAVRFDLIRIEEARRLRAEYELDLGWLRAGLAAKGLRW